MDDFPTKRLSARVGVLTRHLVTQYGRRNNKKQQKKGHEINSSF
ncbi:unnamed protein product [Tetraodon nigroviridis]|uniref:Chromosome 14 SCAF14590, whole genome shotgun sequence n=1 Tax=Tetraodon nigroviridis TaxID=99883 RepID=Q4SH00_TETNG|nr:unnamed protein product [Tetraodon nigroviridis]